MELSDSVWEFQMLVTYNFIMHSLIPWPTFQQNYSLSGEFNTLTKLIFCLVMIRGRHRGLPAAIDRAVMLPTKLQQTDDLIREENDRSQPSIDEGAPQVTSCGASTLPSRPAFRYFGTINSSSLQASSVHQRVRTTSRRCSVTKEEMYDVAENGQAREMRS
jgi:hypothetical protein